MKKRLIYFLNYSTVLLILLIFVSCEDEFNHFPVINYSPCDDSNVIINPNIISDFECQSNFFLNDVVSLRNPTETPLNSSKFVGMYTDTSNPTDFIGIDIDGAIDLSKNSVFKIKVKTEISGELRVMLDGGASNPVFISKDVEGNNGWAIYSFDFSWNINENHKELKIQLLIK